MPLLKKIKKIFGIEKKKEEEKPKIEKEEKIIEKEEKKEEEEKVEEKVEIPKEEVVEKKVVVEKIPTFRERLTQILSNDPVVSSAYDVKDVKIQVVAGSDSFHIKSVGKLGAKQLKILEGRVSEPDIFVRISEDAALELAKTKSYEEFITLLKNLIKLKSQNKYIRVNCLKSIDELRSQGYLKVDLLKILALA
nr:hypothetical protein [Candidatus Baldrarchaeota archaeon]